jgi:hypothetical protein
MLAKTVHLDRERRRLLRTKAIGDSTFFSKSSGQLCAKPGTSSNRQNTPALVSCAWSAARC